MRTRIVFAFTLAFFLLILVIPATAKPSNEITVCSSGCDYIVIQSAIDAATSGDTILVAAGIYTEQLNLKSGLTLTSQLGPTATMITALASPIVSGSNISGVTLQGFSIASTSAFTASIGIDLLDSSIAISNVIISNLHGIDGSNVYSSGLPAIGLQISGTFSVTVTNSLITNIMGGDAYSDSSGQGGKATGIGAFGNGQLTVLSSTIHSIIGGAAGIAWSGVTSCDGIGGNSIGILKNGPSNLVLKYSRIDGLLGGKPCLPGFFFQCPHHGGNVMAIQATNGTFDAQGNLITNNSIWATQLADATVIGIKASNMDRINVQSNEISSLFISGANLTQYAIETPESPSCVPSGGSTIGMLLNANNIAQIERNTMQNLHSSGLDGQASGLYASNSQAITITNNQINHLTGGSFWGPQNLPQQTTYGIAIENGTHAVLDANRISHLKGGQGEMLAYGDNSQGGDVVGIMLSSILDANVTNNLSYEFRGGNGFNSPYPDWSFGYVQYGGNATGLKIYRGTSRIQNNTVYDVSGGEAGYPYGTSGQGAGLRLDEGLSILSTSNAVISNGIGVFSTATTYLWDYNVLWQNTIDYSGIFTGAHDVHLDPLFIDPPSGNFRLPFDSPLIDAGFNLLAPDHDFDGTSRPFDGNGDGLSLTDIGAYEYEPVALLVYYLSLILK